MNDSQIFDLETKNSQTFKKMSSVWLWFSETCFKNIKKNWKHKKGRAKKFKKKLEIREQKIGSEFFDLDT